MKLTLHNGTGKTGSSAIQGFMNYNRERILEESGVLYPNTSGIHVDRGDCHNHSGFFVNQPLEYQLERMQTVIKFAEERQLERVVLSSESAKPALKKLVSTLMNEMKHLDVEILIYFRRQDHWLESAWKEWGSKNGSTTFDEYLTSFFSCKDGVRFVRESSPIDYSATLQKWEQIVPPSNIRVRVYEPNQLLDQNVIHDFLQTLGISRNEDYTKPPTSRKNQNLGTSASVVEFMRQGWGLAGSTLDLIAKDLIYEALGPVVRKKPYDRYPFLSPSTRIEVLRAVEEANSRIARTYLGREDGKMFLEPWPDPNECWEPPEVSEDLLCDHLLQLALWMAGQRKNLEADLDKLRQQGHEPNG